MISTSTFSIRPAISCSLEVTLVSQDSVNNTSLVNLKLNAYETSSTTFKDFSNTSTYFVSIYFDSMYGMSDVPISGTWNYDFSIFDVSPTELISKSILNINAELPHMADGTLSFHAYAEANGNAIGTTVVPALTFDLPTIIITEPPPPTPVNSGPRVKNNGVWVQTNLYVKDNGVWRQAIPYVKNNGAWVSGGG